MIPVMTEQLKNEVIIVHIKCINFEAEIKSLRLYLLIQLKFYKGKR